MIYQGIAALTLFVVLALFLFATKMRRSEAASTGQLPFSESSSNDVARDSTPPSSDGVKLVVKGGGSTARELRRDEQRARVETGLCLYCEFPATKPQPILSLPSTFLDGLYRRFGVVPVARWVVRPNPRTGADAMWLNAAHLNATRPICLCETHHAMACSHLERKVAENQTDYAGFVSKQRLEMYEYQAFGLDEHMLNDTNEIRRGKKSRKNAEAQAPQRAPLKAVNGGQ